MSLFDRFRKKNNNQQAIRTPKELEAFLLSIIGSSAAGIEVDAEKALQCAPVRACINAWSRSIAQMPLHLFERDGSGNKDKAKDHSLYDVLLHSPNDFQTAYQFKETMEANCALHGYSIAYINRVRGQVEELIPLKNNAVTPKQNNDFSVVYEYKQLDGTTQYYERGKDVFVLSDLSFDGVTPKPRYLDAKEAIALALAAEKFGALFFQNGGKAAGAWEHPSVLKPEAFERLRDQLNDWSNGDNAHKQPLLEDGVKWVKTGYNAQESQMLELRKYQVEEIARVYNVQPHIIQSLERSTNNNIEHQGLEFVTHTLLPRATMWEQAISKDLLSDSERQRYFPKFNFSSYLRGDTKTRGEFYSQMVNNGLMDRNEVRDLEELNPRDGANKLTVQLALTELDKLNDPEGENE